TLAIGTTYPAGAAPMTTTASPGRQTRSRVAAAPRTSVHHLGVGSSGSLPGPAVPAPAGTCGAPPESNPGPRPPSPRGRGWTLAQLARPRADQRGQGGQDHPGAAELARGTQADGAAVDHQEQPEEQPEAGQ